MISEAQKWVEDFYRNTAPQNNFSQSLLSHKDELSFQKQIEESTTELPDALKKRVREEFSGWGPLAELKDQKDIFDIIIQGPNHIFYENSSGLHVHNDHFLSEQSFQSFLERLAQEAGLLINHKDPFGNGKAGPFRVHMILPPAAATPTITLRRHRMKSLSLQDLEDTGFMKPSERAWIQECIKQKKNFIVVGPTGSGKTTFLNSLISHISDSDRVVVIEDTDEILSESPRVCKLLSREVCPPSLTPYFMQDLLKQSLRMRPDRIVVGEVRGKEAKDLLQALSTGHCGSMGTLHAESAQQALLRLEMLIQMGAPQWSLHSIRQLIQLSLDYFIVLKGDRLEKGIREICQISSHEKFGLLLESIRTHQTV
jgi:pilus assembly protein CpaF